MRHPDRHTARDRVRVATTGLAVGGAVGVVGVAGGLAVHAQDAASPVTVRVHTATPHTALPTPSRTRVQPARRTAARQTVTVSPGASQPNVQSSGS